MVYIDPAGQVKRLALEPNRPPEPVEGRWTTATSVSASKSGDLLAVGDGNGRMHVSRQGGVEPWSLLGEDTEQWMPILFDETGRRLVAAQWDGNEGAVFDVQTGLLLHRWTVATNDTAVSFARSGNRFIIGFAGGRINIMDPFTGSVEFDLMAPGERTSSFAFDAKSVLLAAGSEYGTTTLWNAANGSLVEVLKGHLKGVHSVAFSPDGKRLFTLSGEEETVKIWDVATRQEVATLPASGSLFGDTRLSDDGNTITSINWRGDLHVWRAPTWEEIDLEEARRRP
jgi:WD40 repeat protein